MTPLETIKGRLANGLAISDGDVVALVKLTERYQEALALVGFMDQEGKSGISEVCMGALQEPSGSDGSE